MIYWLKIILVGILTLFVFQSISCRAVYGCDNQTNMPYELSIQDLSNEEFVKSSNDNSIQKTISHILESGRADIASPLLILSSNSKDNNNNKSLLPSTNNLLKSHICNLRKKLGANTYYDSDNIIISPKDYYIFTLEEIII